jgi:flagellar biosynthesis protein FliP
VCDKPRRSASLDRSDAQGPLLPRTRNRHCVVRSTRLVVSVWLFTLLAILPVISWPAVALGQTEVTPPGIGRNGSNAGSALPARQTPRLLGDPRPLATGRPNPQGSPRVAGAAIQPAGQAGDPVAAGAAAVPLDQPAVPLGLDPNQWTSPQGLTAALKVMLLLTVITLAPSILMMTTCFIRFVIVLSLLRQALGTQQLPPNQVVVSLCLFLTMMVMAPVWQAAYRDGIQPYTSPVAGQPALSESEAFERTIRPLRLFMIDQLERAGNGESVWMFLDFQRGSTAMSPEEDIPQNYEDVPLTVLVPAYMLSELKVAFLIGFQIYLPFLVIDLVISALLISMGMMMLPPVLISLPLKLLLFVLIDGWFLTVGMLLESVRPLAG